MEPASSFFLSRRSSRTSYTDDDDQHNRMSDIEESQSNSGSTNHSPFRSRRRSSSCTSIPSSPSSSYKMSVDSDDGRSISSPSGNGNNNSSSWGKQRTTPFNDNVRRNTHPPTLLRQWQQDQDLHRQQQVETSSLIHMNEDRPSKTAMDIPNPYHPSTMEVTTNSSFIRPPTTQRSKLARPTITLSQSSLCSPPLSSPTKTTAIPSSANNTDTKKQQHISPTESPQQKDHPERRTVRRTSLLLKSKALSRVMHQAEEEIHLADLEMRQEHGTTLHLKSRLATTTGGHGTEAHPPPPPPLPSPFPFPPWTSSATTTMSSNSHVSSTPPIPIDMSSSSSSSSLSSSPMAYQCSKLNPELEMTNFQFENLPSPMQSSFKSIKRKASDDRLLDNYAASLNGLKRRAVSPSVSLSGSPILAASSSSITSPPTTSLSSSSISSSPSSSSHLSYFHCSGNAAARTPSQTQSSSAKGFNLHEASGGISRMSLSE